VANVAVIGGGPAGMMAAAKAANAGHRVTLYERNEKLGKKLFLTGKGRCNVTNAGELERFFEQTMKNPKFLYSALYHFTNKDIMDLLEKQGVPLKVERGGRVFPESDKSSDVISALARYLKSAGVKVLLNTRVTSIQKQDGSFSLRFGENTASYDAVVLAAGGKSYPSTGSDGSGYKLAASLGHTIVEPKPSLIPFETEKEWPKRLQGLSLHNVTLTAYKGKKRVYEELGEMLFTHFGVTGPLVLSASAKLADAPEGARLEIDLKPGLNAEELDRRILRDFEKNIRRQFANSLSELLPGKLIPVIVELSGIPGNKNVDQITKEERQCFAALLKCLPVTVKKARPIDEAIITRGGVSVKEVVPSTMESKLVPGLYFAGELLDVDACTGGYNLQIAYSTGALAGDSIPLEEIL